MSFTAHNQKEKQDKDELTKNLNYINQAQNYQPIQNIIQLLHFYNLSHASELQKQISNPPQPSLQEVEFLDAKRKKIAQKNQELLQKILLIKPRLAALIQFKRQSEDSQVQKICSVIKDYKTQIKKKIAFIKQKTTLNSQPPHQNQKKPNHEHLKLKIIQDSIRLKEIKDGSVFLCKTIAEIKHANEALNAGKIQGPIDY